MGSTTTISWTDHTFNPWVGCTKVSAGCTNCYAEALDIRWNGGKRWGSGAPRQRTTKANWRLPLKWDKEAARIGRPAKVFCASLADVFDAEVPEQWRYDLFDLIKATPFLDWQLLTKRPENFKKFIPGWRPPINVWLGVTVENSMEIAQRLRLLIDAPATVKFLSMEPLLDCPRIDFNLVGVDWVIVGGESGHNARRFDVSWARRIIRLCKFSGVPCFVKQLGARPGETRSCDVPACNCGGAHWQGMTLGDRKGGDWDEWPADLRVREFPAARTL